MRNAYINKNIEIQMMMSYVSAVGTVIIKINTI